DLVLEAPRRNLEPKLAGCVHKNRLRAARLLPNVADVAAVVHVRTISADTDHVNAVDNEVAGPIAQGDVEVALVVQECLKTNGRVGVAGGNQVALVVQECLRTNGRVGVAGGITGKRFETNGSVVVTR